MSAAHRAALLSVLPLLVLTAACGKKDAAPAGSATATTVSASASAKGDADLADVQSYALTMDKVDKYFAVQRNLASKIKAMSPAERKAAMAHNDDNDDDSDKSDDIDGMARRIDSQPQLAAAIREAGLSSREFAVMTLALMQSGMAAGVLKMRPKDDPDSLARAMKANPANVRFYREHEAELTRRTNEMKAEMQAVDATGDE